MLGVLDELDEAALIDILTKPKNAILKQYAEAVRLRGSEGDLHRRRSPCDRSRGAAA